MTEKAQTYTELPYTFDLLYDIKSVEALHAHLLGSRRLPVSSTDAEILETMAEHHIILPAGYVFPPNAANLNEQQRLRERIAELEAELAAVTGISVTLPVIDSEQAWERTLLNSYVYRPVGSEQALCKSDFMDLCYGDSTSAYQLFTQSNGRHPALVLLDGERAAAKSPSPAAPSVDAAMVAGMLVKRLGENGLVVDLPDGGQVMLVLDDENVRVEFNDQDNRTLGVISHPYSDFEPEESDAPR